MADTATLFAACLTGWQDAHAAVETALSTDAAVPEARADALCEREREAFRALMDTPAPDAIGLAHKLKALTDFCTDCTIPSDEIEALGREATALITGIKGA